MFLNMLIWENHFATSCGAAARESPRQNLKLQLDSFQVNFPFTKCKICHVSITTPLDMALCENQLATLCGVAARSSSRKFRVSCGLYTCKIISLSCFCFSSNEFISKIKKLVLFLLTHHSIWHSEKINLKHCVMQQHKHLLEDFRF